MKNWRKHRRSLYALYLRHNRQVCLLPGLETAFQRVNFCYAMIDQLLRQTGAAMFVRSGTKSNNRFITRNFIKKFFNPTSWNTYCAENRLIGLLPSLVAARINKE